MTALVYVGKAADDFDRADEIARAKAAGYANAYAAGARAALAWVNDRLSLSDDDGDSYGLLHPNMVKIVQGCAEDGDTLPAEMVAT